MIKLLATVFWVTVLASKSSGAEDPATEGQSRLMLVVSPDKLVLDRPGEVVVRISLEGAILSEGGDARLHLLASVGTLLEVKREGAGEWVARYNPPSSSFPQVALFAAVARGARRSVHGWAALPMSGAGDAQVSSKPFSLVKIRIDRTAFGPVMTDKQGFARIPVVVAPGVQSGISEGREIPLNVPPFNRIAAIEEREEVLAGPDQRGRIWVVAVDTSGAPAEEITLQAEASRGQVSAPLFQGEGVWLLEYSPPLEAGAGQDTVTIRLTGEPASQASVRFRLVPPAPPAPPPPPAQPATRIASPVVQKRFGLAPQVGLISNLSHLYAPAVLVDLLWTPSFLPPPWIFHLEGGAYLSKWDGQVQGREVASLTAVAPLTLSLSYRVQASARGFVFGRVGGGIYGTWHSIQLEGQRAIQRNALHLGAAIGLGGGLLLSPGKLLFEVRYLYLESRGIEELRGHLGGLCLLTGYQFTLF